MCEYATRHWETSYFYRLKLSVKITVFVLQKQLSKNLTISPKYIGLLDTRVKISSMSEFVVKSLSLCADF